MCGYCIQSEYVLPIVENEIFIDRIILEHANLAGLLSSLYLQESKSLPVAINKIKQIRSVADFKQIVFCRIWEMLMVHPSNLVYQILNDHFSSTEINEFLEKLRLNSDELSAALSNVKLYQDIDNWNQFVSNEKYLTKSAEKTLSSYYNWWLVGDNESDVSEDQILSGRQNKELNKPSILD